MARFTVRWKETKELVQSSLEELSSAGDIVEGAEVNGDRVQHLLRARMLIQEQILV